MDEVRIQKCLKYLRIAKSCFMLAWIVIAVMILIQFENIPLLLVRMAFWIGILMLCLRSLERWKAVIMDGSLSKF